MQVSVKQNVESLNAALAAAPSQEQSKGEIASDGLEQQIAGLRAELAATRQEAESLRARTSISTSLANAPVSDGEKSVADQVAEHAEAVRVELERRHQERVKETEEIFAKRTQQMKDALNKKLAEGKEKVRQTSQEEHEQVLATVNAEHKTELDNLLARHKEEIEELKRHEEARFSALQATLPNTSTKVEEINGEAPIQVKAAKSEGRWQPSDQEIKNLVQSNDVIKNILRQNVIKQVNKAKEELTAQLKDEHGKDLAQQLAEAQSKAESAKEQAVALETKKTSLQLNLQTNKTKIAQFKLDIISKAAEETPQKPVSEVWVTAKDARAPAAAPGAPSTQSMPQAPVQNTGIFGRPTPIAAQSSNASPLQTNKPNQPFATNSGPTAAAAVFGRPTPTTLNPQQATTTAAQAPPNVTMNILEQKPQQQGQPQPRTAPLSTQGPPTTAGNHPNNATGPQGSRSMSSGLPVARGGPGRGGPGGRGGQRGRGTGIPRGGGAQSIDTQRAQGPGQGRGSPTSAFNPGAKQFVPGNKRPREDGQDNVGGEGKRLRGTSAGADTK